MNFKIIVVTTIFLTWGFVALCTTNCETSLTPSNEIDLIKLPNSTELELYIRIYELGFKGQLRRLLGRKSNHPFLRKLEEQNYIYLDDDKIPTRLLGLISAALDREIAPSFRDHPILRVGEKFGVATLSGIHTHPHYRVTDPYTKFYQFPTSEIEHSQLNVFGISKSDIRNIGINLNPDEINYFEYIVLGDGRTIRYWKVKIENTVYLNVELVPLSQSLFVRFGINPSNPSKGYVTE